MLFPNFGKSELCYGAADLGVGQFSPRLLSAANSHLSVRKDQVIEIIRLHLRNFDTWLFFFIL